MKLFAIRRKHDGAFLPSLNGQRGYTGKAEPSTTLPPRLFNRRTAAADCLRWWSEGAYRMHRSGGQNPYSGEYDYDDELRVDKVEGRNAADFEIVEVALYLKTRGK